MGKYSADEYTKHKYKNLKKYKDLYDRWYNELMRYDINLFAWRGIPCTQNTIETYYIRKGVVGSTNHVKYGNIIVTGGLTGVTNYPLEFSKMVYATPLTDGIIRINKTGVIGYANSNRTPDTDCIESYAHILTHIDLSIQAVLINMRATNAFLTSNQAQRETVKKWLEDITDGVINFVGDSINLKSLQEENNITTLPTFTPTSTILSELYNLKQNTLRDFFAERGFVTDKAKAERLVSAEVSVNSFRVMFSVSDMLEQRQDFCERANALLKVKYSVQYNEWIKRQVEEFINNGGELNDNSRGDATAFDTKNE